MELNLRNISVRSRFFLFVTGLILIWLFAGFLVYSLINNLSRNQQTSNNIQTIPVQILSLESFINGFYTSDIHSAEFHESGMSTNLAGFNNTYLVTNNEIRDLILDPALADNALVLQKLDQLKEYIENTDEVLQTVISKSRQRGWNDYGISGTLREIISEINDESASEESSLMSELITEIAGYLEFPASSQLIRIEDLVLTLDEEARELESLQQLLNTIRSLMMLDQEMGVTRYEGLQGRLYRSVRLLHDESSALVELYASQMQVKQKRINWGIVLIILLSAVIITTGIILISRSIARPLTTLRKKAEELAEGKLPEKVDLHGGDELKEISESLDIFITGLRDKAHFASDLAEGKDSKKLNALGEHDLLAHVLNRMEQHIKLAKTEELKHQKSREERRWANEGVAKFGNILRAHNNEINALAENVILELVNYLDASAGGFFLMNNQEEKAVLNLIASFAFDRKKYLQKQFSPGEGLVGTCAIEKEKIVLTEIPEDYINISSGLGEGKPRSLLLMPLKLEDQILGVLEIASISRFKAFEIEFLENLAESIASSVSTVQMNMRTAQLLEQSQKQASEMAKQEEIMRQNMEELKTTQEESARRESEISGILNAIHNSSLVAEYNMEEELISMNDKFLLLLESQSTQMIGKRYHEILGTSKYTDTHKEFWEEIREGKTITKVEKISVPSGQDLWLRQTFTPILDEEGTPFKVLNIASDITETIEQQESLTRQANEITRANIEMKSFSDAVDHALIKCVYSPAGQILEVNEIYENATGYTEKEMIGKNNRVFLQRVEKEQFERIWEDLKKDKPYRGVIRRTKPTGEEIWIMSTFTPVKDENGNIFKVFYLGQDITERKLKYQLLEEANKEIERLRKQLDERG